MEDKRRGNYGSRNTGSENRGNRGYGSNFGDDARPYGEDYGEDVGYQQQAQSRFNIRDRMQSGNRAGFRHQRFSEPQDWMMEDQGFDYGMARTGSHANVGRFHFDDYDEMEDRNQRGSKAGMGRGYMSDEDYDRGSPYNRENRGYGGPQGMRREERSGYSQEDYPQYRERYSSSNYPDTYRSARSGYMSEYVGDDAAGRQHPNPGRRSRAYMEDGPHRGKGPRNYKRSDDRIKEEINDRLTDDPFVDCSDVEVSVENGEVTLTGSAVDKTQQRRIEDIAGSVRGVTDVDNRLRRPLMSTPF